MQVFICSPAVHLPNKKAPQGTALLRFNILFYDEAVAGREMYLPGAFVGSDALIHLPMYRLGPIGVPSLYLGAELAGALYDAVDALKEQFPDFFPLMPKDLAVQALLPTPAMLASKFPEVVRARQ